MPVATDPSSLSDVINAAAAAADPAPPSVPADPPAASAQASETPVTDAADPAAAVSDTTQDDPAAGAAAEPAAAAAAIDWGAAMPALRDYAKSILGEDAAWLAKPEDMAALIRQIAGRERQVGELSHYVGAFNQLQKMGWTVEDLQRGPQRQATPPTQATNGSGVVPWNKKFQAGSDAEGRPIWNRAELARAGISETQAAQSKLAFQEGLADRFGDEDSLREYIASVVDPRMGQVAQQTRQELTQAQQMREAQLAEQADADAWCARPDIAKALYINGRDASGGYMDAAVQVGKMVQAGYTPQANATLRQRYEAALSHVMAAATPRPATPANNEKAKRQPATGAKPAVMDPNQFYEKHHENFADQRSQGLQEYLEYVATGKVPTRRGAA
jgi:hypothetical protein